MMAYPWRRGRRDRILSTSKSSEPWRQSVFAIYRYLYIDVLVGRQVDLMGLVRCSASFDVPYIILRGKRPDRTIAPNKGDEGFGERKLVLESARFLEGGRHLSGGAGHLGRRSCDGTGSAEACRADGDA